MSILIGFINLTKIQWEIPKFKNPRRKVMKKTLMILVLSMLLCPFASAQYQNEFGQDVVKMMMVVSTHADGTSEVHHYVMDPETDMPIPLNDAGAVIAGLDAVTLQQLVLTRSWHWRWAVSIAFNQTPFAKTFRSKYKNVVKKFINQRRGNNGTPKMSTGTAIKKDKTQDQFNSFFEFLRQFNWDNNNSVVMTEGDWFFKNQDGTWQDPVPGNPSVSRTVTHTFIFASATLQLSGNRLIGTYYIQEADVYLHTQLFALAKLAWQRIAAVAFEFAYGYQGTIWSTDMLSNNPNFITNNDFTNKNSNYWKKTNYPRDDFYYRDSLGIGKSPVFLSTPWLLPFEMEVLDIGGYRVPEVDELGNVELGFTPILFLTNLIALDGSKKTSIKIFRIDETVNPAKDRKIVYLSGNTMRYPESPPPGWTQKIYTSVFLNNVRLGRESDLAKLENAVWKYGTPMTINGVDFDKVIKIKVKLTGRLGEKGAKKTIVRIFYLVDTPQPWEL